MQLCKLGIYLPFVPDYWYVMKVVEKQFQWKPERQKSNSMENFRTGAGTRVLVAIFMSPTVLWHSSAICM